MCGFITQLVEHRTGIAVTGSNPVEALIFFFFQASSFQLLKLENSLRESFFTFITLFVRKKARLRKILKCEFNLTDKALKKVFSLPHSACIESYVKAFQFKILNSILYTNFTKSGTLQICVLSANVNHC